MRVGNKAPPPKRKPPGSGPDQHARFVELARELGCEEDEEAFERAVRTVAAGRNRGERKGDEPASDMQAAFSAGFHRMAQNGQLTQLLRRWSARSK